MAKDARRDRGPALALAAIVSLLALGALVRYLNLADNPGWDGDEGYNWNIAANLAAGRVQMYGLRYTFVQHPPVFYVVGALAMRLWTHDLLALRAITATCGVLSIAAIYAIGVKLRGRGLGLCAAGFYAIWPQAVLQTRWAYTYNMLSLFLITSLLAALPRTGTARGAAHRRELSALLPALGSGTFAGLALATDQEAVALLPALAILLWPRGIGAIALAGCAAAVPPLSYVLWMLLSRPTDFLFDIRHTASRLNAGPGELLSRFSHMLSFEPFLAVGFIGLLLLPGGLGRRAMLALTAFLLFIVLEVRDPSPLFRAAEPLLPLAAIGVGTAISTLLAFLHERLARGPDGTKPARAAKTMSRAIGALVVMPFAVILYAKDYQEASGAFDPGFANLLPRSASDARVMAAWVNRRTSPSDLVLVMPATSWLFRARTADLLQAVAITGNGTAFYPSGLGRRRFVYDTHLEAARYLVVDHFLDLWIRENVRERTLVTTATRSWPVVFRLGEYNVYANPRLSPNGG